MRIQDVRLLSLLVLCAGGAFSDTLPALEWSGTVSVSDPDAPLFLAYAEPTSSGFVSGSVATGDLFSGTSSVYTVETDFTVTSAGGFLLSSDGSYAFIGGSCTPSGSCSSQPITSSLSVQIDIFNASAIEVFSQNTYEPCPPCSLYSSPPLSASNGVDLGVGDYTLEAQVLSGNTAFFAVEAGTSLDVNLVPTPEPKSAFLFAAVLFAACFARQRKVARR